MLLASKGWPAGTMNAIVQALIPPPKYDITKLVPERALCSEARLAGLVVIERADDNVTRTLEDDEAIEILMDNCDDAYGFPPYPLDRRVPLHALAASICASPSGARSAARSRALRPPCCARPAWIGGSACPR